MELFYRNWTPGGAPLGVLVLVHGLGEHSGRYRHVGEFLCAKGLAVYALDQQGHGRSEGVTGSVERFEDFLDDLEIFHRLAAAAHPTAPLLILGHSMGGLIVTAYLLEKSRPDAAILSAPAIVPLLSPGDRSIDPTRLSKDPALWEAYLNDPLILRERVTEQLMHRLGDGLMLIQGRAAELELPMLLIHGEDDALCSLQGARDYLQSSSVEDLSFRFYPGGRHEMFNETNRDEVLEDMWAWISPRL